MTATPTCTAPKQGHAPGSFAERTCPAHGLPKHRPSLNNVAGVSDYEQSRDAAKAARLRTKASRLIRANYRNRGEVIEAAREVTRISPNPKDWEWAKKWITNSSDFDIERAKAKYLSVEEEVALSEHQWALPHLIRRDVIRDRRVILRALESETRSTRRMAAAYAWKVDGEDMQETLVHGVEEDSASDTVASGLMMSERLSDDQAWRVAHALMSRAPEMSGTLHPFMHIIDSPRTTEEMIAEARRTTTFDEMDRVTIDDYAFNMAMMRLGISHSNREARDMLRPVTEDWHLLTEDSEEVRLAIAVHPEA